MRRFVWLTLAVLAFACGTQAPERDMGRSAPTGDPNEALPPSAPPVFGGAPSTGTATGLPNRAVLPEPGRLIFGGAPPGSLNAWYPELAWRAETAPADLECAAEPEVSPIDAEGNVEANYQSVPNYGDDPRILGWGDSPTSLVIEENTRYPCYGVGPSPDQLEGGRCSGVHVVDARCPTTPLRSWHTGYIRGASVYGTLALTRNFPFEYGPPVLSAVDLSSTSPLPKRLDRILLARVPELSGMDTTQPTQALRLGERRVLLLFATESRSELVAVTSSAQVLWHRTLPAGIVRPAIGDGRGNSFIALSDGRIEALSPDGRPLWSRAGAEPVAVFRDTLFLSDGSVVDPESGALRYERAIRGELRITARNVYEVSACGPACTQIEVSDRQTGTAVTQHRVDDDAPRLLILSDGRILVGENRTHIDSGSNPWAIPLGFHVSVLEQDGSRTPLFAYRSVSEVIKGWALVDDFLVLVRNTYPHNTSYPSGSYLVGIAVPGLRPERSGWLTGMGNMSNTWTPESGG